MTDCEWISVNDRLPQRPHPSFHREWYLVAFDTGVVSMIFFDFDSEEWNSYGLHVTHWMPLPEAPKEKKTQYEYEIYCGDKHFWRCVFDE